MKSHCHNSLLKKLKNNSILLLSACTMLVSCQQELKGPQAEGEENLLTFNARVDGSFVSLSRGTSGDVTIESSGFTTIGYMTDGLFSISDATKLPAPNVFNAENSSQSPLKTITRDASTQKYQVELPKIEHKDGSHLSFFAWAQAAGEGGITATTDKATQTGYPWIDVEVALPNQTQRDVVGANTLNLPNEYVVSAVDLDFTHLLSKLSFKIKAPTAATANIVSTQCSFGADKVYQKGRFTFNGTDTVGVWADRNTYFPSSELSPSDWSTPTLTSGDPAPLGEMLLLPQKVEDGFLTVKVNYTLTVGGVVSEEQSRTVSLRATELLQGRNYIYTLLVNADEMSLFNISIAPWIEGETASMPLVPGPKGNVILLLDGNIPPYTHTDGKVYWLDTSGWSNHCLIDNSASTTNQITYDEKQKGYVFNSQSTGSNNSFYNVVRVPDLGMIDGTMSCELVATLDATAQNSYSYPRPIFFSPDDLTNTISNKKRAFNFECLPKEFRYEFGGTSSSASSAQGLTIPMTTTRSNKTFYAFTRSKNGRQKISYNQYHNYGQSAKSNNNSVNFTNGVIGSHWKGIINYVKITKDQLSESTLKSDYAKLKDEFKINPDAKFIPPPPVTEGLVLCLQGISPPNGTQWKDYSINGNDAKIINNHGRVTYSSTNKCMSISNYQDGNSPGNNYIYITNVGDFNKGAYTIEFAAKHNNSSTGRVILFDFNGASYGTYRSFYMHYPYDGNIDFFGNQGYNKAGYDNNPLRLDRNGGEHFSVVRSYSSNYIRFYRAGTKLGNDISAGTIEAFNHCYIGRSAHISYGSDNSLYFLRIYNRVLTTEERNSNRLADKAAYGHSHW